MIVSFFFLVIRLLFGFVYIVHILTYINNNLITIALEFILLVTLSIAAWFSLRVLDRNSAIYNSRELLGVSSHALLWLLCPMVFSQRLSFSCVTTIRSR